ncbi:PP-loop family protein [Aspergillus eucalypticola CBS 122712]|uniref:tRNA(Ile)-lysidine synthetase n=1 Tax=Aspergillus eucalypticola (strain CBS 122712 / IBT 29274) TaxID=1448314 RepID=A0A317VLS8_ASPEC|nr:PP-loop family protein [Aspergillus eucalypticola CBS 122712]PWY74077.1 PP-loop family protein [Aspergillus eucalypticola CBS 122712]
MASSHLLRHTSPGPLTVKHFIDSFQRIWLESRPARTGQKHDSHLPRRLGLAISGGADSMALAYLCKQWELTQRQTSNNTVSVTAFVVDHKAREESTREANMVAGWLDEMGLTTQILPLTWPSHSISAFETHARRLRFQALGQACRARNIETLLMGHHQDDNVETTLWRLCTGARGAGLAGIPAVTRIPECHGLFGVAESGFSMTLSKLANHNNYRIKTTNTNELRLTESPPTPTTQDQQKQYQISTGGISITRPLLSFPKQSLLATCKENNIPYVDDPTNFDPTLTPRNAIRSLLAGKKLPRALREESILSLMRKSNSLLRSVTENSNDILSRCEILEFAPDTGCLIIKFPSSSSSKKPTPTEVYNDTSSLTLRRITELISPFPENHFPLRSFEPFVPRVFPSPSPPSSSSSSTILQEGVHTPKQHSFTLGGVMFQPLRCDSSPPSSSTTTTTTPDITNDQNTYLLTRQPYMRNRLPFLPITVPIYPPSSSSSSSCSSTQHSGNTETSQRPTDVSDWHLWDNRYWFRVTGTSIPLSSGAGAGAGVGAGPTSLSLVVRPLQKSDLKGIRMAASKEEMRVLMDRLGRDAPGLVRFTLPLLVYVGDGGMEVPMALPTMEMWLPGAEDTLKSMSCSVRWEWMYKMIDREPLERMGWLKN